MRKILFVINTLFTCFTNSIGATDDCKVSFYTLTKNGMTTNSLLLSNSTITANAVSDIFISPPTITSNQYYIVPYSKGIKWRVRKSNLLTININYTCSKKSEEVRFYMPMCGDVNGDGTRNIIDSQNIREYLLSKTSVSNFPFIGAGDVGYVYNSNSPPDGHYGNAKNNNPGEYPEDHKDLVLTLADANSIERLKMKLLPNVKDFFCEVSYMQPFDVRGIQ